MRPAGYGVCWTGLLTGLLTGGQRYVLDQLLVVPPGSRVSDLERRRKGPVPRGSSPAIIKALEQVSEIMALGLAGPAPRRWWRRGAG